MVLLEKIKRVFNWIPIIWKMGEWDFYYLLKIMYHQISFMKEANDKYSPCVKSTVKETSDSMQEVLLVLKRLMDDNYLIERLKPVEEKYGELELKFKPCEWDDKGKPLYYEFDDNRTEEHQKAWTKAAELSDEDREKDEKMLWELLPKYYKTWWY